MAYLGNTPTRYDSVAYLFSGRTGSILTGIDMSGKRLSVYPKNTQVFLNGVLLVEGVNYTIPNNSQIVFANYALVATDYVSIICSNIDNTNKFVSDLSGKTYVFTGLTGSLITGTDMNGRLMSVNASAVDVYLNGIMLFETLDFQVTSGTEITLVGGTLDATDHVLVRTIAYQSRFSLAKGTKSEESFIIKSEIPTTKPSLVFDDNGVQSTITATSNTLSSNTVLTAPDFLVDGKSVGSRLNSSSAGFKNYIINGGFDIWQRGNGPFTNGFTADRWGTSSAGTGTSFSVSRQVFSMGDDSVPGNPTSFLRYSVLNGGDATFGFSGMYHLIEDVRTLANRKVTLTFWAKADVNGKKIALGNSQLFGSSGDSRVDKYIDTVSLTTSWKKYQLVWNTNSIVGKTRGGGNDSFALEFYFSAGTNFNTRTNSLGIQTGVFDIARISVVEGDATKEADPFEYRTQQQELALCQRYYTIQDVFFGVQASAANQAFNSAVYWQVTMRTTPSCSIITSNLPNNTSSHALYDTTVNGVKYEAISAAAGRMTGAFIKIQANAEL